MYDTQARSLDYRYLDLIRDFFKYKLNLKKWILRLTTTDGRSKNVLYAGTINNYYISNNKININLSLLVLKFINVINQQETKGRLTILVGSSETTRT